MNACIRWFEPQHVAAILPVASIRRSALAVLAACLFSSPVLANCVLVAGNSAQTPDSKYSLFAAGLVVDDRGLMWKSTLSATAVSWSEATTLASGDSTAGFTDWRLPTLAELGSIVETGCNNPAINTTFFDQPAASTAVWTSTEVAGTGLAWYLGFTTGFDEIDRKESRKGVRLVRDFPRLLFADGFE